LDYKGSDWANNWIEDTGSLYRHTMKMEQMMEHLLSEIRTNQSMMDSLASCMDVGQVKSDADLKEMKEEMKAKLDSN
jgi:hypothetical protein